MEGWIPAYRALFERDDWMKPTKANPASYIHAWLDLCQLAQWRPFEHETVRLNRGEVLVSVRGFAKRWRWSKSAVSRFLNRLESGTMIGTVRGTPHGTVYRIVKYDTYAVAGDTERDTPRDRERDTSGTPAGQEQERTTNKTATNSSETVPVSDLWDVWIEELGGTGRVPKLTAKRRDKLKALWVEHLKDEDEPLATFRRVLKAVQCSDHHMGQRSYQMPESLFLNEERRDRWVMQALSTNGNGKPLTPVRFY